MKRTSLEIDEAILARVKLVLGTSGIKETVDRAFSEVLRADLRRSLGKRIASGDGVDRGEALLNESRPQR